MSKKKSATDFDQASERPSRPKPTNRISTPYECVEAHGVGADDLDFTKDQTERRHELPSDNGAAIKAGAIKPGTIDDDRSLWYERGEESAKRRADHVLAKRRETEKLFDSLRPSVEKTRRRLGR
jgi:hypothetical protein